jgi:hypothetical protein
VRGWRSEATRAAFVSYRTGRPHSDTTRAKIAATHAGRVRSDAHRQRISAAKRVSPSPSSLRHPLPPGTLTGSHTFTTSGTGTLMSQPQLHRTVFDNSVL